MTVSLTVCDDDPATADRQTRGLLGEVRALDVDVTTTGAPPPDGARGVDPDTLTTIVVTLSGSWVLVELASAVRDWITRADKRTIVIRGGDRSLEITGTTLAQRQTAIEAFLRDGENPGSQ